MIFQEVKEIFSENAIKCGSHKKILSDLRLFDQEMDIDTLKLINFLDKGIELTFELSTKNDLIINLPQFYPFKVPEIYIVDLNKNQKVCFKEFINKKRNKNVNKKTIFNKLDNMFIQDIPSINLVEVLEEIMNILKFFKLGWFSNN
jgi:hypothetical protein